jgi:flavin-dependent dehydrogenase
MSRYYDVIVSGGGPAGLAAAIHAARAGLDVVVFDPHGPGAIDKACGEGIMPGGVEALQSMGVSPAGRPFMGIRYVLADDPTCEAFGNFPLGGGLGVRRTVLSEALHARAQRVGVRFRQESISSFTQTADEVTLSDGTAARWLIAADGLRSPIRRALDLELSPTHPLRFGLRRHYALSPWSMHVEVHFAGDAEAYVTPVADDLVGVAILFEDAAASTSGAPSSRGAAARFDALLSRFPHLSERLMAAQVVTPVRGAGPFEHRVKQRVVQNVLLIGDAAGYLDPLTGEGIALGAATAQAAIEALRAKEPASYERRYHEITRRYFTLTGALLAVVRHPRLHRPLIRAAHAMPGLFDTALGALAHLDQHEHPPHGPLLPEAPVV